MSFNVNDCDLIVIEAVDTDAGIDAEYAYITEQFGPYGIGWELQRQKVLTHVLPEKGLMQIDVLTIELANGELRDIAFDITSFYGKWG
jgi:hypothetical protein